MTISEARRLVEAVESAGSDVGELDGRHADAQLGLELVALDDVRGVDDPELGELSAGTMDLHVQAPVAATEQVHQLDLWDPPQAILGPLGMAPTDACESEQDPQVCTNRHRQATAAADHRELAQLARFESLMDGFAAAKDAKGRIILSPQSGALLRATLDPNRGMVPTIEPLGVPLGDAHGLLVAGDSLYVVKNGDISDSGLFRFDYKGPQAFIRVSL